MHIYFLIIKHINVIEKMVFVHTFDTSLNDKATPKKLMNFNSTACFRDGLQN